MLVDGRFDDAPGERFGRFLADRDVHVAFVELYLGYQIRFDHADPRRPGNRREIFRCLVHLRVGHRGCQRVVSARSLHASHSVRAPRAMRLGLALAKKGDAARKSSCARQSAGWGYSRTETRVSEIETARLLNKSAPR